MRILKLLAEGRGEGIAAPLKIVRLLVVCLHIRVQPAISGLLRALGAGRCIFGGDAIGRLEAYRRGRLAQVSGASKKDYLLSFPRSGNHWTRFILEFFSGMPTKIRRQAYSSAGCSPIYTNLFRSVVSPLWRVSEDKGGDFPIYTNLFRSVVSPLWHVSDEGCLVYKSHSRPRREGVWTTDCNSVLLLIRHYYETEGFRLRMDKPGIKEESIRWYLRILLEYERANARKMHVYYEDLIRSPRETIASILAFYGIDNPALFEYFMRNYRKMQRLSRNAVGRCWRPAKSGDDLFYRRRRRPEKLPELNELFQRIYSERRYDEIRHLVDRYYAHPD